MIALELIAVEYGPSSKGSTLGTPIVHAYNPDKSVVWTYTITNPAVSGAYQDGTVTSLSAADVDGDGGYDIVFGVLRRECRRLHGCRGRAGGLEIRVRSAITGARHRAPS